MTPETCRCARHRTDPKADVASSILRIGADAFQGFRNGWQRRWLLMQSEQGYTVTMATALAVTIATVIAVVALMFLG
jgi:hypothetical protein